MKKKVLILAAALLALSATPAQAAKKIPSTTVTAHCPTGTYAHVVYKVDKNNLLKFWADSYCDGWVKASWGARYKGKTKTATLFVRPWGYTDLWKAELNPMATRRVDWIRIEAMHRDHHPCDGMPSRSSYQYATGDQIIREWCP